MSTGTVSGTVSALFIMDPAKNTHLKSMSNTYTTCRVHISVGSINESRFECPVHISLCPMEWWIFLFFHWTNGYLYSFEQGNMKHSFSASPRGSVIAYVIVPCGCAHSWRGYAYMCSQITSYPGLIGCLRCYTPWDKSKAEGKILLHKHM